MQVDVMVHPLVLFVPLAFVASGRRRAASDAFSCLPVRHSVHGMVSMCLFWHSRAEPKRVVELQVIVAATAITEQEQIMMVTRGGGRGEGGEEADHTQQPTATDSGRHT